MTTTNEPIRPTSGKLADIARAYANAKREAIAAGERETLLKQQAANLERLFIARCTDEGIMSIKVLATDITIHSTDDGGITEERTEGMFTLSPFRQVVGQRLPGVDTDKLIAALRASSEYSYLATETVSASALSAAVRTMVGEDGSGIPDALKGVVQAVELEKVSMTRA